MDLLARWTAISLLAAAFLAVAAAWQRVRDGSTAALELIPHRPSCSDSSAAPSSPGPAATRPTAPHGPLATPPQYHARQAHQRWHAYADEVPQP